MSAGDRAVGAIASLLVADGADFVSRPVSRLVLTLAGIEGDRHAGMVRRADARTPWHPRRARIANTRQISIVSVEECDEIAALMGVPRIDPALLGATLVVMGLPALSLTLPGTRLQLPLGATVFITEQNAPCRHPADKIVETYGRARLTTTFARAAIGRRGLVGLVEREGTVAIDDVVQLIVSPARVEAPKLAAPTRHGAE